MTPLYRCSLSTVITESAIQRIYYINYQGMESEYSIDEVKEVAGDVLVIEIYTRGTR